MKIRKRSGIEVDFDRTRIENAIEKANGSVSLNERLSDEVIKEIALNIERQCATEGHTPSVEEVQDKVVFSIMEHGAYRLANNYITYRYEHQLLRQANSSDDKISALLNLNNEEA